MKDQANKKLFILNNPIVMDEPFYNDDNFTCSEIYFLNTKNCKLDGVVNYSWMQEEEDRG